MVVLWLGCRCCRPSVNTICGRIMIGLSLLSSISKHNMWSCYDSVVVVVFRQQTQYVVVLWLACRCLPSVNTICGGIMIGLSLSSVSKHNMWSCYDWVFVVVVRQLTQYVIVLWLGCRCCRPSVNTICGRIMIGLSLLSSISKHNMWSCYDSVVVVVFRQ
jgi:hypothetical protein